MTDKLCQASACILAHPSSALSPLSLAAHLYQLDVLRVGLSRMDKFLPSIYFHCMNARACDKHMQQQARYEIIGHRDVINVVISCTTTTKSLLNFLVVSAFYVCDSRGFVEAELSTASA